MIGIVIAMHSNLAESFKSATERILGIQEKFYAFDVREGTSLDEFARNLKETIKDNEFLVLVDFFGGSPCNCALKIYRDCPNIRIISGVNFPMVLSAITRRKKATLDELAEIVCREGKDSIKEITKELR